MDRNATWFMIVFEFVLGSLSFGALFATPTTLALKLLIGCLILLFVGYLEFQNHQRALHHELSLRFNEVAFRVLERGTGGSSKSLDEAYQALQSQLKFNDVSGGEGRYFGLVLCGKLGLWIGAGALVNAMVLPEVARAFS